MGRVRRLLRWRTDEGQRGAVLPLTAVGLVAALAATALTVDIGRISNRRRDLQSIADIVALDASKALAGRSLDALRADPGAFLDSVERSARANRFLEDGAVRALGAADADDGFVPHDPDADGAVPNAWSLHSAKTAERLLVILGTVGGEGFAPLTEATTVVDAVRVVAHDRIDHHFSPGSHTTSRAAVASAVATAGAGIRSGLASVDGSLQDQVIGQILGVDLAAVDYEGLADARVTLRDLAGHFEAGSLEQLVGMDLRLPDVLHAYATILHRDSAMLAEAEAAERVAAAMTGASVTPLSLLTVAAGSGGEAAAMAASIDALWLVTGAAYLAGRDHAGGIGLTVELPGFGSVPLELTVIEPPQWVFGPTGSVVRTAQVAATLAPQVAFSTAMEEGDKCQLSAKGLITGLLECTVSLLGILPTVPVPNLVRVDVAGTLDLEVAVARGQATISDILCAADGVAPRVTLDPIAASAAGYTLSGVLEVTAVLLPGDGEHETPVTLPIPPIEDVHEWAARLAPGILFDGDPETEDPLFGEFVPTGGGIASAESELQISYGLPSGDRVLDVLTRSGTRVGAMVAEALRTVIDDQLEPLLAQLPTHLEGSLGVGLANAEVTAVAPSCNGTRLVV